MITQSELNEFNQSVFTGITVGVGSLVFLFSTGGTILVQCPFQCGKPDHLITGHGESPITSSLLFPFLNQSIKLIEMQDGSILKLVFFNEHELYIIPDTNGLESYVITTSQGPYPVIEY